jgi:hypothetical protein
MLFSFFGVSIMSYFDFDVNACVPEVEKVCDDDKDNDNDDKVDLEDSNCHTNEKEIEQKRNKEGTTGSTLTLQF